MQICLLGYINKDPISIVNSNKVDKSVVI